MQTLEYCYFIAFVDQVACACKSGRACSYDGYLMAVALCRFQLFVTIVGSMPVGNESLKTSDGYRHTLFSAGTNAFALGLLRADTSADSRKSTGIRDDTIGFREIPLLHLSDEIRNPDIDRASADAQRLLAVQAACCVRNRFLFIVSETNLIKIMCTDLRVLLSYRNLLHHICHYAFPPSQFPQPPECVLPS